MSYCNHNTPKLRNIALFQHSELHLREIVLYKKTELVNELIYKFMQEGTTKSNQISFL